MDCREPVAFAHKPVLLGETLEALAIKPYGRYLDGTEGLGGHSRAILEAAPGTEICGLDRDAAALELAGGNLKEFGSRVHLFHMPYASFSGALDQLGWDKLDGALLDLGLSSMQLDDAARGFSFNGDAALDMRMDQRGGGRTARELVNREPFENLREWIAVYGEDPQAGRIARRIVEERQKRPIDTTSRLADIVRSAYPPAWRGKSRRHPATRTFQALRMVVNDEPGQLRSFLDKILARLADGGRLAVISFHSLEDRMVKHAMRRWALDSGCSRTISAGVCGHGPEARLIFKKPVRPGEKEVAANPRASSAKLRAAEKLAEA